MSERVQLSRAKGWRMPPNTVSVARSGRPRRYPFSSGWGNPFVVGTPDTPDNETAVAQYRVYMAEVLAPDYPAREHVVAALEELRGKNLACWCALDRPCHADVLLELAARCEQNSTAPA